MNRPSSASQIYMHTLTWSLLLLIVLLINEIQPTNLLMKPGFISKQKVENPLKGLWFNTTSPTIPVTGGTNITNEVTLVSSFVSLSSTRRFLSHSRTHGYLCAVRPEISHNSLFHSSPQVNLVSSPPSTHSKLFSKKREASWYTSWFTSWCTCWFT